MDAIKIKFEIEKSIEYEHLINLFSTALYGNDAFACTYDKEFYKEECDPDDDDCFEDKLAKTLLKGGYIIIYDMYSDDENDKHGSKKNTFVSKDFNGHIGYPISLDDIIKGIKLAIKNGYGKRVESWLNEDWDFDLTYADCILQYIVYEDYIYG